MFVVWSSDKLEPIDNGAQCTQSWENKGTHNVSVAD